MKSRFFAKLAVLCAGALFAMGACGAPANQPPMQEQGGRAMGGPAADMQAFYNSLSPEAKRKFEQLDRNGQDMARQAAQAGQDPNKAVDAQFNSQRK